MGDGTAPPPHFWRQRLRDRTSSPVTGARHACRLRRRRVVGVEYVRGNRREVVRAQQEVVVCAGAIGRRCCLMRSGIGPAADLRPHGIPVVDLPGVGANLQDHLKLSVRWRGHQAAWFDGAAGLFTSSSGDEADLQVIVGRGLDQADDVITITVSHLKPRSRGALSWPRLIRAAPRIV